MKKSKPIVVVVEDKDIWLNRICNLVNKYFDVTVERFSVFHDAEERLLITPSNINLLIIDIFPSDDISEDSIGLKFADFATEINKTPVIVITGRKSFIKTTLKDYNVLDVFYKGEFDRIEFLNSVNKVISFSNSPHDIPGKKDSSNNDGYIS